MMDRVPAKDGRPCIFRVVRVSGTIRKAEEEAIRQAKQLILAAKEGAITGSAALQFKPSQAAQQQDQVMIAITDDSADDSMGEDDD